MLRRIRSRGYLLPATLVPLVALMLAAPVHATAQVVFAPRAGAESSYRNSVIRWLPIPGAASYHLQVDDNPAFGSPEVDVVVAQPIYELRGDKLQLNGQLSWPAYVRINGRRWQVPNLSPGYVPGAYWPEMA